MARRHEAGGGAALTVGQCLREVQRRLGEGGVDDAAREARRLVSEVGGIAAEALIMRPETELDAGQSAAIEAAVAKRVAGMPLGRIVGERAFFGRRFGLNEATLEPRADSETLIEAVLEIAQEEGFDTRAVRIVDVGTGSGCLLVTLLAEMPQALGHGRDIAPGALEAAQENARRHGVAGRVEFSLGDALEGLTGPFDILISNPPYIQHDDISGLDEAVRCHDPWLALDGGPDGLAIYRQIAERVDAVVPEGWIVLEIGAGMRGGVCALFDAAIGTAGDWRVWRDINGHERCVARRTR